MLFPMLAVAMTVSSQSPNALVQSELIYETAPFPSAHASTIVETKNGLVAAWFGGTREGAPDVGIWVSRKERLRPERGASEASRRASARGGGAPRAVMEGVGWTAPVEVANGVQPDGTRYPCWNPVLFELPRQGLTLFYKVGPSPQAWWGMSRSSSDNGRTWSDARRLPDGILGPVKNKPVRLADGAILSGSSTESSENPSKWRVHFERSTDGGATWTKILPAASGDGNAIDAIQPSILMHPGGRLQAVGRTRAGRVYETWSSDNGRSWSALALTVLPNPSAGTDAVTLRDGRHLIVYNHTEKGRTPLNVAVSKDGKRWEAALVLESEPGEYSYPAVIQSSDGLVHVTYTWKRQRIKHATIDPVGLKPLAMPDGKWPVDVR
jgi:predicted neuraminidase